MIKYRSTNKFDKDLVNASKTGKNLKKIKEIMIKLINKEPLDKKYRVHKLKGNYKGRHECHIEPDWLLIYKIDDDGILFERTGFHSELFSK